MPAKKQIPKETLLDAAFEIVRKEGMGALNMRALAKKCGCSTQPIYLSFRGADEVKEQVWKRTAETYARYLKDEVSSGRYNEYKAFGMGYIRFAKEEKQLFRLMFMSENSELSAGYEEGFDDAVKVIREHYELNEDQARILHAEMWIFVHGIGVMYATDFLDWKWEFVEKMVSDAFSGLLFRLRGDGK